MRILHPIFVAGLLLVASAVARPVAAQSITGQDSTLVGLKRLYVKFDVAEGSLSAAAQQEMQDNVLLELRKSGIRIARTPEEIDPAQDGIMLVQFAKVARSLSDDAVMRIDIRQAARLARTGRNAFMVTWFHEDNGRNVLVKDFAAAATKRGVNEFLTHWLDMNGR
jgi:hypothetical protein